MTPQLNLPNAADPTRQTVCDDGAPRYDFTRGTGGPPCGAGDTTCREFAVWYFPSTGSVEFLVDGSVYWSATIATGRAVNSIYVRDYFFWNNNDYRDGMCMDDLALGTTSKPAVTHPVGGEWETTATPTINWTRAFAPVVPRTGYQVHVCSTDDPTANVVYDSGELTGSSTSHVPTTALPTNQRLWAFVNEKYVNWTGWSLIGTGGFYCVTAVPTTPTVTSPSGTVVGAKPAVTFSGGVLHSKFDVKITTTSDGSGTPVWDSGEISSMKNGASCSVMLSPGTQ